MIFKFFIGITFWVMPFSIEAKNLKYIIYMQADNDLVANALWDIREIQATANDVLVNYPVFVELDLPGNDGVRRFQVDAKEGSYPEVKEYFEGIGFNDLNQDVDLHLSENYLDNQADKLEDFIRWSEIQVRTQETILIIWGHGEGWSSNALSQFGGIALDDNPKSKMTVTDLRKVLLSLKNEVKIGTLITDACLMQTMEVAYEFTNLVDYVIGSTQIQSLRGLPYTELLTNLSHVFKQNHDSEKYPFLVAQLTPKIFSDYMHEHELKEAKELTISSVSLFELNNVFLPQWSLTLEMINEYLKVNPFEAMEISRRLESMPKFLGSSRDIATLIGVLESYFYEQEADYAKQIVIQLKSSHRFLARVLVDYQFGEDYLSFNHYGHFASYFKAFGLWFPASEVSYHRRISDFQASRFFQSELVRTWQEFLKLLFNPDYM